MTKIINCAERLATCEGMTSFVDLDNKENVVETKNRRHFVSVKTLAKFHVHVVHAALSPLIWNNIWSLCLDSFIVRLKLWSARTAQWLCSKAPTYCTVACLLYMTSPMRMKNTNVLSLEPIVILSLYVVSYNCHLLCSTEKCW